MLPSPEAKLTAKDYVAQVKLVHEIKYIEHNHQKRPEIERIKKQITLAEEKQFQQAKQLFKQYDKMYVEDHVVKKQQDFNYREAKARAYRQEQWKSHSIHPKQSQQAINDRHQRDLIRQQKLVIQNEHSQKAAVLKQNYNEEFNTRTRQAEEDRRAQILAKKNAILEGYKNSYPITEKYSSYRRSVK
ncbi:Hypothetical_protein [Hexamita inflata]|uniref:Hypothetical_protein n=1 Tax=Hexamita inflata TaxID=28002 RepID=A0AA86NU28_9EUKA|nr:Hypothetical protein HINF_LOCUS12446 [Hexamita inflata]